MCFCAVYALLAFDAATLAQAQAPEYQVKAAFIYHFVQLVDWPPGSLEPNLLNLCVFGDDPFQSELEQSVEGKTIGVRMIHVRRARDTKDLRTCQIGFLGRSDDRRIAAALADLGAAPVLTVGDSDDFAQLGGMIGFVLEDNKIRFNINLDAADRSGLKISSKLLLLAKQVIGNHGGK